LFREKIPAQQLSAWLFAALVPVALQILGGGWIWALCIGGFAMALAYIQWRKPREPGKLESAILLLYVTILTGQLLHHTAGSWPVGNSDPAVPLILLVLATWSAQKGPSAAARVGAVLFWAVLGLYAVVLVAGVKDIKMEWLIPELDATSPLALVLFLLPCACLALLREKGTPGKKGVFTVAFVVSGMIITSGVLSPGVAVDLPNAFYEMGRSLDLLGVARRFEALICAGATVGWFALLTVLLSLCGIYTEKIFSGKGREGVVLPAIGAALWKLCGLHIMPWYLLLAGAIFWVIIPFLAQGLGKEKKS
jgi:hypothetical protein